MKKKFIILGSIAAVLVVAGIILAVALLKPNEQPPVVEEPTVQLETPRGITLTGKVLSWDSVENATEYVVYVNDKEYITTECSFDLTGKANERDIIKVVARAKGYIDSKFSIEKIFITVIDKQEITSMSTTISDYISKIGFTDQQIEEVAVAIENVCVALFKEGLVAEDVNKIVTTVDSVVTSLESLNDKNIENASEFVEALTNEVNKLVDLNISSFALTVAVKEVVSFVVDITLDEITESKQNMSLIVTTKPVFGKTKEDVIDLLTNVKEYLDNISNRDLEKIALVFDSFKNTYIALKVELPAIIEEIKKIEVTVEGEPNFDSVYSVVVNLVKIKDSVISAVLNGMPSMEDFTEVISLFESLYDNLAPEYIVENNPYDLVVNAYQHMYSKNHQLLSFLKEIDADMIIQLKPYFNNIFDIYEKEVLDYATFTEEFEFGLPIDIPSVDLVMYILQQTGLTQDEIEDILFDVLILIEDISENPQKLLNNLTKEFTDAFKDFDYSIITEDPLVKEIMEIALSEDKEAALESFLKEDLKIEQYISFKEGKSFEDLTNALLNLSIEDLISYLTSDQKITLNNILEILGIDEIVNANVEGLAYALIKMANVETFNLINDLIKIHNITDIENILAKYFKVEVNFKDLVTNSINNVLAEYNLDLEYKTLFENVIKNLSLDQIYAELGNVYGVFETTIKEFNANYKPLVPTKEPLSKELVLEYTQKYALYGLFGNEADVAIKDLNSIYDSILALKEHDEIVTIFKNVMSLFTNFDYSFDLDKFINDDQYLGDINDRLIKLLEDLLDEADNTFEWVIGFESDLKNIAKNLDKFTDEYFGITFEIYEVVKKAFEELDSYELTSTVKKQIIDFVEEKLDEIFEYAYDAQDKIKDLAYIYELVLSLQEHDEIVDIIKNIETIVMNFDYSFDYEKYLNDESYKKEFNNRLIKLLEDLLDEADNTFNWVLEFESDFQKIAKELDKFTVKHFGVSFKISEIINYVFDKLDSYELTSTVKKQIIDFVEEKLDEIFEYACDAQDMIKDLTYIYELVLSLQEHDEIVEIIKNIETIVMNFDYSFNFEKYLNDESYKEEFNNRLINLLNDLLDEGEAIYNWVLGTESDFETIAKSLDKFTVKHFGTSFEIYENVNYAFELLDMYKITEETKVIMQRTIKDVVENILEDILVDSYELAGKGNELFEDLFALLEDNFKNVIEDVCEFYKDINVNQYLNDEEYRNELNQKLVNLLSDLIDEFVIVYDEVLTTEDCFKDFAIYIDELCNKYFGQDIDLTYTISELFEYFNDYKLTSTQISDLKEIVRLFVNEYFNPIFTEAYNVSDEVYEILKEAFNEVCENSLEMFNLVYELNEAYILYCKEAIAENNFDEEYIYSYEYAIAAIEKLYSEKEEQINELCDLLELVVTPSNKGHLTTIDNAIENISDLFGLYLGVNATSLYKDLIVIIDLVRDLPNLSILDKIQTPDINIEDVIIPQ